VAVLPAAAPPRSSGRNLLTRRARAGTTWSVAFPACRVRPPVGAFAMLFLVVIMPSGLRGSSASAAVPPRVEVATGDGAAVVGTLAGIDESAVRLADSPPGSGTAVAVPLERVRSVRRAGGPAGGGAGNTAPAGGLFATLVDGSTIDGDDVAWDGSGPVVIVRAEGRVELPAARVRSVAWRAEGAAPGWIEAVPDGTESDLVVIGTAAGHEFVECAIVAVSAEAVTVLLDEEKIPVKRSKVIGLEWLRDAKGVEGRSGPGRLVVDLRGGRLQADRVAWSADGLVVDGVVRLPADTFAGVDFAAGRRMSLAAVAPDRVEVEPWFGGLGRSEGLASFFAPRTVPLAGAGAGGPPTIVMRPRTTVVWRLPADGRRFRGLFAPAAGAQTADATMVVVTVDDKELFRGRIDAASGAGDGAGGVAGGVAGGAAGGVAGNAVGGAVKSNAAAEPHGSGLPLDLDVTAGRRLVMTIDFAAGGGIGSAVRLVDPVIER